MGVVVKRTLKLALAIVSLVVLLAVTGYINLALNEVTTATIYKVVSLAPTFTGRATEIASALPLSSAPSLSVGAREERSGEGNNPRTAPRASKVSVKVN